MKEGFLIKANWLVYRSAILKHLPLLGVKDSKKTFRSAKAIYRSEMKRLPEYGKYDVLKLNLSHAVMLGAIYESCEEKPTVDRLARFYREVVLSPGVVHYAFSMKEDKVKKVSLPRIPTLGNTRLNRSVSADLLLSSHAAAFATI